MELIKITQSEGGKQVVSARELYSFLSDNMFNVTRWMALNIENNNFAIQGIDYQRIMRRAENNRNVEDYALTISFAKKLAMMANTNKGNEVRDYFIECEKRLLKPQIPQTFAEALQLAADQAKQLELQAPKVQFADSILESNTSISVSQMAKILGYGPNNFFSILRDSDILMKFASRKNTPYQRFIDAGYFEVTERAWVKGEKEGITFVTRVTPKGQKYLTKKFGTN